MPADYCGPFTIDNIDDFGTLEQINVSFDDASWASASTCIYYTSGSITADAQANASGYAIRGGVAQISATGFVSSSAYRIRTFDASITASGSIVSDAIRLRTSTGSITASASVSAVGGMEFSGSADINAEAFMQCNPYKITYTNAVITGISTINCVGRILGEEWTPESAGTESWTADPVNSNTWTNNTTGNNTWH